MKMDDEAKKTEMVERRNQREVILKGFVVKLDQAPGATEAGRSNVELEDPDLSGLINQGRIIVPPFDPLIMAMLPENSTILEQCVSSMEVNIDGFGHRFVRRVPVEMPNIPPDVKTNVAAEQVWLQNLFAHFCGDLSFVGWRRRIRRDLEITGNAYTEVVKNGAGKIDQLVHIPSYQMRLSVQDAEYTEYRQRRMVLQSDGSVKIEEVLNRKRFRRFVQFARLGTDGIVRTIYTKPIWFKELEDPRPIDALTGNVLTPEQLAEGKYTLATPVVHFRIYSPRSPYGIPRWIGNLITIIGDREADNVNFVTLRNNNVPSMIIAVSNGELSDGSIQRIKDYVETHIQGSHNYSRILIIEAASPFANDAGEGSGNAKIDVKPVAQAQTQDQLFQAFGENNRAKVREAFRLPPIFVGRSDTYNRSTAETSRKLADEQVFAPERLEFDFWMNHQLFPLLEVKYHKFQSMGPNITDDEDLIKVLIAAEKTGGMTPRIARYIIEDIMGREFPENWKDMDPDVPLTLQLAERVKNTAPMTPGAQVMAMKALGPDADADVLLKDLMGIRERLEAKVAEAEATKPLLPVKVAGAGA